MAEITDKTGPFTLHFLAHAKDLLVSFNYGYFDGMRDPSLEDLKALKMFLKAAIKEKKREKKQCD